MYALIGFVAGLVVAATACRGIASAERRIAYARGAYEARLQADKAR